MNTRRYHRLLVAATAPPLGRLVLLAQLDDTLVVNGERYPLSTNLYQGGFVYPSGYLTLREFRLDPNPVFTFGNGDWEISRTVRMTQGQNTTTVQYCARGLSTLTDFYLEVRPLIAFRDYHSTTHENAALNRTVQRHAGGMSIQPYADLPKLLVTYSAGDVITDGYWYRNFEYERGLDAVEDLFSPLIVRVCLSDQGCFVLSASAELQTYPASAVPEGEPLSGAETPELIQALRRSADRFVVTRPPFKTIIAGYHWFGDWGRDTMIALPGLLLQTNRPALARDIFIQFVRYLDAGMLPNRFPDGGEGPEYNTVDAALWFIQAVADYINYRQDAAWRVEAVELLKTSLYTALQEIVRNCSAGTRYGIHADADGFLWAGNSSTQLTWMDARVHGVPVTPRHGRPVEIQALW